MPNPNPGNPNPPGSAGNSSKYPQYGLDPKNGKIIVASNSDEKIKDIDKGYVEWFVSHQAAENKFQAGKIHVHIPDPLSGIDSIGASLEAFYDVITDGKMWRSLAWIALGVILIVAGIYLWIRTSDAYVSAEHAIEGAVGSAVR